MHELLSYLSKALLIGIVATAFMDIASLIRERLSGVPAMSYGLVGRWLGHLVRGRFRHDAIAAAPSLPGEQLIGWTAHYVIGIAFAAVLLVVYGLDWTCDPTLGSALTIGISSVLAPFLVTQPGMGAGIAASRTANPAAARVRSLITHTLFGVGLYIGGLVAGMLIDCAH